MTKDEKEKMNNGEPPGDLSFYTFSVAPRPIGLSVDRPV
jgi:hypothetical protein